MALSNLLRSRLALRIYLVGLAQVAVVAAGFFAILVLNRPERTLPVHEGARIAAERAGPLIGDRAELARELERINEQLAADVTIVGPDGAEYASSPGAASLRCPRGPGSRPPPRPGPPGRPAVGPHPHHGPLPTCMALPIPLPAGEGTLHYLGRPPPAPPSLAPRVVPLVLLVVGVSSLLLAWSLVRPLRRISLAARALGSGDLGARVRLRSKDELGDVARAFDDMAERVSTLLRAEKELLANVSHELRTPLARIRVALELAAEGDIATAKESLVDIAADLDELEGLLSDVLTAARLDLTDDAPSSRGLPPLRMETLDLHELLESAAQRFRSAHPERELQLELASELPALHADRVLLRRMIENLLTNAHKYTEDPLAPVELLAQQQAGELLIEVVDRGIGIAEQDLPHVFRPFFRADRSRTRSTGGLGLGLALAQRIAEAHGGRIELHSEVGVGTRARVRLPTAGRAGSRAEQRKHSNTKS